jgi:nicotinate phosphoribosyltransferase
MKLFPQAVGTFEFFDRDNTQYTEEFIEQLRMEISNFCSLRLTHDEQDYMTTHCRFIPSMYWEWLSGVKLNSGKVQVWLDEDKHLHIKVTDYLYRVTLYEVPILAMVSELRNKMLNNTINMSDVLARLAPKIVLSNQNQIFFSEFGTRRRYSYNVQENVIKDLKSNAIYCTGTSNCYLAMKYDMPMMGTHPHEWFMFHGAMYGYKQANYMALENWVNVYDGDLGIALSDTYTSAVFFKNLSRKQAKLFDGIRQDSGDEFKFVTNAIARYKELGIDPTTKTIIFSNALTFDKALEIREYCRGRIRCAFGIGTNLTNDTGHKPSNIVMKLTSCQMNKNQPVFDCVKLSDDLGKHTGSAKEVELCLSELRIK